jgi:hypothetical protein
MRPDHKCVVNITELQRWFVLYKDKLNTLLESRVYELLTKDSEAEVEMKVQRLLSKHKTALLTSLKHKLTVQLSKSVSLQ